MEIILDNKNKFADKLKKNREYTTHGDLSKKRVVGKKKPESEKKIARITLNLTQDELSNLEANADELGIKTIDYARMLLKKAGAFNKQEE
jgi:hypothetical protein